MLLDMVCRLLSNVCRNFILPETGKPCLLFCLFQFAQLIVPYLSPTRKGVNLEGLRDLEKRENRKEQERGRE